MVTPARAPLRPCVLRRTVMRPKCSRSSARRRRYIGEEHVGPRCLRRRFSALDSGLGDARALWVPCDLALPISGDFKIRGPLAAAAQVGPALSVSVNPRARLRTSNVGETVAWVKELSPAIHSGEVPRFSRGAVRQQISPVDTYDTSTEPLKSSFSTREMRREPKPIPAGSDTGGPPNSCQTKTNFGSPA